MPSPSARQTGYYHTMRVEIGHLWFALALKTNGDVVTQRTQ